MQKICYFHAGCPDGFGAAWSAWRGWGELGRYLPRGHDDEFDAAAHEGDLVVFADISPPLPAAVELGEYAAELIVLDHHITARDHFEADPGLVASLRARGHKVNFDLTRSGAVLAWQHFHPTEPVPSLLAYVEDQDLWNWELPESDAVNAAIGSYPRDFNTWDALSRRSWEELAAEGAPILRERQVEVQASLRFAHPVKVNGVALEAVNALHHRSHIGHELAKRSAHGRPIGLVYRLTGSRVDISIYSIGDEDVSAIAASFGGGGHRNASGFSVTLDKWTQKFL